MPETPTRRGPGRPRKVQETEPKPEPEVKPDPDDPRIGTKCPKEWNGVGYDDGSFYRCENGKHVERLI